MLKERSEGERYRDGDRKRETEIERKKEKACNSLWWWSLLARWRQDSLSERQRNNLSDTSSAITSTLNCRRQHD